MLDQLRLDQIISFFGNQWVKWAIFLSQFDIFLQSVLNIPWAQPGT